MNFKMLMQTVINIHHQFLAPLDCFALLLLLVALFQRKRIRASLSTIALLLVLLGATLNIPRCFPISSTHSMESAWMSQVLPRLLRCFLDWTFLFFGLTALLALFLYLEPRSRKDVAAARKNDAARTRMQHDSGTSADCPGIRFDRRSDKESAFGKEHLSILFIAYMSVLFLYIFVANTLVFWSGY